MSEPAWKAANRAHWDEKVALHLGPRGYDLTGLRAGRGCLNAIEEAELWPVDGSRVLHLQCHFGADTLALAQRGATVVGLDFSSPAIAAADRLAAEVGLADRARFVQADLYDAPAAIPEPAAFDANQTCPQSLSLMLGSIWRRLTIATSGVAATKGA